MQSKIAYLTLSLLIAGSTVFAFQPKSPQDVRPPIADIIRRFSEAETQNKIARNNYMFTQDFDLMRIGEAGSVAGRYHRVSEIVFDDRSNRIEKITFFPPSTAEVNITQEDMQDMAGVQPFALTAEDLPKYQVDFVTKEKIDELNTYVFDVKPKAIVKGQRYLEGRLWVDDQDLQIVKVAGRAVPQFDENKFPKFETYRENIDGRFWFPTYVYADDVLEFKKGPPLHLRIVVRYTNYRKFGGRIRMADDGEATSEDDGKGTEKAKSGTPAVKPPDPQQSKPELKKPPKKP